MVSKSDLTSFAAISDHFGKTILFIILLTPPTPSGGEGVRGAMVSKHYQGHNGPKLKVLNAFGPLCNILEKHIAPN